MTQLEGPVELRQWTEQSEGVFVLGSCLQKRCMFIDFMERTKHN